MQQKDLRPANDFAIQFGVKSVIYGPPGSAKTPLVNTCPRPVLMACEPGLLSMRGSNVPTWQAYEPKAIDEFFAWLMSSAETKNFDTVAIDSTSQMSQVYLNAAKKNNKHGLQAYGEMAEKTYKHLYDLYYLKYKHTYLIAQEEAMVDAGLRIKRPFYEGKFLPVAVPHLYDNILRLAIHNVPGMGQVKAFRCNASLEETARNRSGLLAEFEPPDFSKLVTKAMG